MKSFYLYALLLVSLFVALPLQAVELWVTIGPQKYFVERIGGDAVAVEVLVRPGQSPELYSPSAAQLVRLAKADAYVGIGLPVEHAVLPRIVASMPQVRILQTGELADAHDHHHHEGCAHGDHDPHVWMDPAAMIEFVGQVRDLLAEIEPSKAELFQANADRVVSELKVLDAALKAQLDPYAGRVFYINHPALGHFAERYGIVQRSLEQAGTDVSARRIAELVKAARADQVGAVFTQPEFGRSSAAVLARALKVDVVELNPLAEDYFKNLQRIADKLVASFE
ncbi:MAG: metal ABC transporter solute-binding protein, Zn/Mn family [Opitutaceae bacterium]